MTRDEIFKILNWNQVLAAITGDKFMARIEALVAEAERREREAIIAMEVERTEMKKPEAIRLAEWIEDDMSCQGDTKIAAELRRLHAETVNQRDWYVEWKNGRKWPKNCKPSGTNCIVHVLGCSKLSMAIV